MRITTEGGYWIEVEPGTPAPVAVTCYNAFWNRQCTVCLSRHETLRLIAALQALLECNP